MDIVNFSFILDFYRSPGTELFNIITYNTANPRNYHQWSEKLICCVQKVWTDYLG